jgi:crotonobetainyl-CoA:carnitine CoA-transferase CaiB-like acyl-CoA transferase
VRWAGRQRSGLRGAETRFHPRAAAAIFARQNEKVLGGEMRSQESAGPLAGVIIIDMTTVVMGPYATAILADYGATVIKVEPPSGDIMRYGGFMKNPGMGAVFLQLNRNKRSIVLDVKQEAGRAALLRLAAQADVFIHNIRPAAMRRARLGEDDVRGVNPRLVYMSLVGYGQNGPNAALPAYDDLIQGRVGFPHLIGRNGGGEPRYVPSTLCDHIVGLNAVHAVLAALIHRDRTGTGQAVELPMLETMAQFVLSDHMGGRTFEPPIGTPGYIRMLAPDRRPYRTKDGYICALVYTDKQWQAFYKAIGREQDFSADPRLGDPAARARHFVELYSMIADILTGRTTAEWTALFEAHDIPCGPVNDLDALIDDAHLETVEFIRTVEHPTEGPLRIAGIPSRWSGTQPEITRHPPNLGEHSEEILREFGFDAAEVAALMDAGVSKRFRADEPAKT